MTLLMAISLAGMVKVERFREYQKGCRATVIDPQTGLAQGAVFAYQSAALKADPHDTGLGFALAADAATLTTCLGPATRSTPSGPEWMFRFTDEHFTGFVVSVYRGSVSVREYTVRSKYRYWTVSEARGPTVAFLLALRDAIARKPVSVPGGGNAK